MNTRKFMIVPLVLTLLFSRCATHELVLSRTLRPVISSDEISFPITLFHARVQQDRLEVWARIKRSDNDYRKNFDCEIESAAALCAALVKSELTFKHEWNTLVLQLTNEYGSQWRWKNTLGFTIVRISRETMIELRRRGLPPSEYPQYWHLVASKVGPPDFVPYEWSPAHEEDNPAQ